MRNITKVAIVLALAALTLVFLVPMAVGSSTKASSSTQGPSAGYQAQPSASGTASDGCQDSAALVTGYDPITGLACPQASP